MLYYVILMFIVLQLSPESDNRLLPLVFRPIFYFIFLYINNPLCNIFVCLGRFNTHDYTIMCIVKWKGMQHINEI